MDVASKYWQLVRIDASGKRKIREIPAAKAFFAETFGEFTTKENIPDIDIQHQLIKKCRDGNSQASQLAECCLRCCISWLIEQVCWQLAAKFKEYHGLSCNDLLPYVLDDDGRLGNVGGYKCFSSLILESFNLEKSSLAVWTSMKVKQHPGLLQFLLESGVYIVSDWAILNDTQPKQLERIFRDFHCLTELEIQRAKHLLEAYHAVYRFQRLQKSPKVIRTKCPAPTLEQLHEITLYLHNNEMETANNQQLPINLVYIESIMAQLENIAAKLRQYRIHIRGASLATESLDANAIERIAYHEVDSSENEKEEAEFLQFYHQQFLTCLEQALAIVTESRVKELERKDSDKAKSFLIGLQLFHCQKLSMAEIAKHLKLRAQDAVTRLLKLKEFRADVRQQMLLLLRNTIQEKAIIYSSVERLQQFENQITLALNEQINKVIESAETQSRTAKNLFVNNLFIEKLCKYLDNLK
jgi:hypothetical protein